jgi:hypothetical protein
VHPGRVDQVTGEGGGASRTTEPAAGSSSGTDVDLLEYVSVVVQALDRRSAELRAADFRWLEERDRRYSEVTAEREKALKIKEEADTKALELQRSTQSYKDEKANELREQISSERGLYATKADVIAAVEKMEATLDPVIGFMRSKQGQEAGITGTVKVALAALTAAVALLGIYAFTQSTDPVIVTPTTTVPVQTP